MATSQNLFTNEQLLATVMKALKKTGKLKQAQSNAATMPKKAGDSVSLLTGGQTSIKKPATQKASVSAGMTALMGKANQEANLSKLTNQPASQSTKKGSSKLPTAHLRYKKDVHKCVIKDINLREILAILKTDEGLPDLLEQTVVQITRKSGSDSVQLNGYVHSMTAAERKMDSQLVNVKIVFVDEDPKKFELLSLFIQSM